MGKGKKNVILIVLAVVFFFIYSYPYFFLRPEAQGSEMWIFNTPDETANYFFIDQFSQSGNLTQDEPLNNLSDFKLVHPRGTTVIGESIAPGTFLGFILFEGAVSKIITPAFAFAVIPFFSIFTVLCFYFLIKEIFGDKIAFWSALLLLFLPAFWYYNSRSLFNNVLFVDFLIIGWYFLRRSQSRQKILFLIFGGLIIGLALTMRTSDALWVGVLSLVCFFSGRNKKQFWPIIIFAVFVFLPFIPILFFQNQLFGSPFAVGYAPKILEKSAGASPMVFWFKQFIAPFGFNLENVAFNIYHYFVQMFWWLFWPAFFGALTVIIFWRKNFEKKIKIYFISFFAVSFLICLYYGSWFFYNNLMMKPLIGSSQARYLLPIYIMSLPLLVYFADFILSRIKIKKARLAIGSVALIAFIGLSINSVFFAGEESLSSIIKTVKNYQLINKEVSSVTETDSVIISSYSDKMFFPRRKVIFYWQEPRFLADIGKIAAVAPVYFYDIDNGREVEYIKNNSNLKYELVKKINEKESLYRILK